MEKSIYDREEQISSKKPIKVAITGPAGNIGYSLCFQIGQGHAFGIDQPLILSLIEIPEAHKALKALEMELHDSLLPCISGIIATTDEKSGFEDADFVILLGAKPRSKGMERKDLLSANAKIFKTQGQLIDAVAKEDVKVLVVGNPANTNALVLLNNSKRIKRENVTALTRLDQNRSLYQLGCHLNIDARLLRNVFIWGNHSLTQVPDLSFAQVFDKGSYRKLLSEELGNESWVEKFTNSVQRRGAEIIEHRGTSSAASAAIAICDHIRSWLKGTAKGEIVSMAVCSDGNIFGIPDNLIFSFPVTCSNGRWTFFKGPLPKEDAFQARIKITVDELLEERKEAFLI